MTVLASEKIVYLHYHSTLRDLGFVLELRSGLAENLVYYYAGLVLGTYRLYLGQNFLLEFDCCPDLACFWGNQSSQSHQMGRTLICPVNAAAAVDDADPADSVPD